MSRPPFADRVAAGSVLAHLAAVQTLRDEDPVVVGLPRGGVIVAEPVAEALGAPLGVLFVRKLGVPGHEELAMGAIGEHGVRILDRSVLVATGTAPDEVAAVEAAERAELERQSVRWRDQTDAPVPLTGRTVLLVDDGIATGSTALVAVAVAEAAGAARVVVAVPVAPSDAVARLEDAGAEVVVAVVPRHFRAVGEWYVDFRPTADAEVRDALARSWTPRPGSGV